MSQFNKKHNESQADQIYFDLVTSNFESSSTVPVRFSYNEQRANPFLLKPEDYDLSIIRFTMDSATLPVLIPSIKLNSASIADTIYSITLEYKSNPLLTVADIVSQQYIQWIPQDKASTVPVAPSLRNTKLQDNLGGYYNCYNYTYFVLLIYEAFALAFADIEAQALALAVVLPTTYQPIVNWDSTNNRMILYADEAGYNLSSANPINIYFNTALYSLFNSFPATIQGFTSAVTLGRNTKLGVVNVGDTNLQTILPVGSLTSYKAICLYQEYSTTSSMSPIVSVVFTSNTLPIQSTQVSSPVVYYNGVPTVSGSNADIANIITDIVADDGLYKPNLVYEPLSQYRLITLYGNSPISNLDIQIYYKLKDGSLQPFLIQSGGAVTLKIAFIKKKEISKF
jgi:hypothetical protein